MMDQNKIIVFQADNGAIELKNDLNNETIWATQAQIAKLFGVNPQAITKHINNIYQEKELLKSETCSKMEQVQTEGTRKVSRQVLIYNLEIMISVGYRISSKTGTKFRQWATKTLKSHIKDGYTINSQRINRNSDKFLQAVDEIKQLLPSDYATNTSEVLDLIKLYANTWFSLEAYDKASLPELGFSNKQIIFTSEELELDLQKLKHELVRKKEATDLFGQEKQKGNLKGIVGNILQSFDGKYLYPTIELKAAYLLYFIVKNHPYTDGNKRSGAFAFLWLLNKAQILRNTRITAESLTTLTLLVAESDPSEKERVIGLILLLLENRA